ncbi:MAG: mismatch-specific DNA-glycosylase [Acidimicrobiales bacterium]
MDGPLAPLPPTALDALRWLADHHRATVPGDHLAPGVWPHLGALTDELPVTAADLVTGAGFIARGRGPRCRLERAVSLADEVAPTMTVLVVGLNPSPMAAERGVGYARPGNRFWPAALAAGLVTTDRDARAALTDHGVGFTDMVKRTTRTAAELTPAEFRAGLARLERLTTWLRPAIVAMVGLQGWRAAVDRRAVAGWQHDRLGPSPVYVMPSTSGLNAHATLGSLADHLRAAMDGPPSIGKRGGPRAG